MKLITRHLALSVYMYRASDCAIINFYCSLSASVVYDVLTGEIVKTMKSMNCISSFNNTFIVYYTYIILLENASLITI